MSENDGRFLLGAILVSFGITYILNAINLVNSTFWLFIGLILVMEGFYYGIKRMFQKTNDASFSLATAFFGIAILLFVFGIVYCSFSSIVGAILLSIGLGIVIPALISNYSPRKILWGIVLMLSGILFWILSTINIPENFYRYARTYGIGLILIILGILVIFKPNRERRG